MPIHPESPAMPLTPRKALRGLMRTGRHALRGHGLRRVFGELLHQPNLWHLNRNSVSWAVSVGLFMAMVPLPGQMIYAAAAAVLIGCNLPIAVALVWVTNPITFTPIFFAAYKVGAWLLNEPPGTAHFERSMHWFLTEIWAVGPPLLLGSLVLGVLLAVLGQVVVRVIWRIHVVQSWRERRRRRMSGTVTYRSGQLMNEGPGSTNTDTHDEH